MRYDLRVGTNGRRILFWPENEDEKRFLGGFTGEARVELKYDGHPSYKKVNQLAIYFVEDEEEECTSA